MKKFLIGVILGSAVTMALYFYFRPDLKLHIPVGRLLDRDAFYLKNGDVLNGWILSEDANSILLETDKGTFTLPQSSFRAVQRNVLARYLKQLP